MVSARIFPSLTQEFTKVHHQTKVRHEPEEYPRDYEGTRGGSYSVHSGVSWRRGKSCVRLDHRWCRGEVRKISQAVHLA